jgi:hypothetical protein
VEEQNLFTQEFIDNCRETRKENPDLSEYDCVLRAFTLFTMKHGDEYTAAATEILMRLAAPNIFSEEAVTDDVEEIKASVERQVNAQLKFLQNEHPDIYAKVIKDAALSDTELRIATGATEIRNSHLPD